MNIKQLKELGYISGNQFLRLTGRRGGNVTDYLKMIEKLRETVGFRMIERTEVKRCRYWIHKDDVVLFPKPNPEHVRIGKLGGKPKNNNSNLFSQPLCQPDTSRDIEELKTKIDRIEGLMDCVLDALEHYGIIKPIGGKE